MTDVLTDLLNRDGFNPTAEIRPSQPPPIFLSAL